MKVITLTTDFGISDPFVSIMKGIILNICPATTIVDITHNISPQDIRQGSFILKSSYCYFPKGTIHLCVVDPSVGSLRKPILIQTENYFFIGPDNGLFTYIIEDENILTVIELTEQNYWLKNISQTFHGRDIFSPVAAYLAKGEKLNGFGKPVKKEELVKVPIYKPIKTGNNYIGKVQYIDHFGNIITNIPNDLVKSKIQGKIRNIEFTGLMSSFAFIEPNKLGSINGSSGYIELFVNKGNAAKLTGAQVNDNIEFHIVK